MATSAGTLNEKNDQFLICKPNKQVHLKLSLHLHAHKESLGALDTRKLLLSK